MQIPDALGEHVRGLILISVELGSSPKTKNVGLASSSELDTGLFILNCGDMG